MVVIMLWFYERKTAQEENIYTYIDLYIYFSLLIGTWSFETKILFIGHESRNYL